MRTGYSFDDVLIVPSHHSTIRSRSMPSTRVFLGDLQLDHPIVAAPMDTVVDSNMLVAMAESGGIAIMHRYQTPSEQRDTLANARSLTNGLIGAAIGTKEEDILRADLIAEFVDVLCIDVANGDHMDVVAQIKRIKTRYPTVHVMAGNVATGHGFMRLMDAGANSVRVGIGPGAGCSTRLMTGIGVPQLTAIEDCTKVASRYPSGALLADGGIRNPGDLCKALAAGASACILGSVLAGTVESPGEVTENESGDLVKYYRGMASEEAQRSRGTDGVIIAEGVVGYVPFRGHVADVLLQFNGGLRSSMTYVNAWNLFEFKTNTEFIQITPAAVAEGRAHVND